MSHPIFSVILTTYKRTHLLPRAIRSVLGQTFRDFELIVVDDAGDLETAQVVHQFSDDRIILIRHDQNRGTAASRNTGIKASRGALITILDDDDEYYPIFLEKTNIFFQSAPSNTGFVWTGIRRVIDTPQGEVLWYERLWPPDIQPQEAAYIAATTIGSSFGLTMRRDCIGIAGLFNEAFRVCEDTEYLFRLVRRTGFATIPEILIKIHRHGNDQLTHQDNDRIRLDLHERILEENADFFDSYPKLYYIHARRLVELCYALKMNKKGRRILRRMWTRSPRRVSIFMDLVCYECFGVDSATYLTDSRIKRIIRNSVK